MDFQGARAGVIPYTFTAPSVVRRGPMSISHRVAQGVIAALTCLGLASLTAPAEAQRSDRATISGVVTDAQGAGVPGATVTIKNEDTGVETVQVTNDSGAYTPPPLV